MKLQMTIFLFLSALSSSCANTGFKASEKAKQPESTPTAAPAVTNPTTTSTLTPSTTQPSASISSTPIPIPTLGPKPKALFGGWIGLCSYTHSNSNSCDIYTIGGINAINKGCPAGYTLQHAAARFQGPQDNDARNEWWTASCLRSDTLNDPEILANPANYAIAGNWYGLWASDGTVIPPARTDKSCPTGFIFQSISSRYKGLNEGSSATCVAQANGPLALPPPTGSFFGFCAYNYDQYSCNRASLGITQRKICPVGYLWSPFSARFNGANEIWTGTCVKL